MTRLQKEILFLMLTGSTISRLPGHACRVREANRCVKKINESTFQAIKYLLRQRKDGLFVINKNEVRKQRGNTWVKKAYKLINGANAL